MHKLRRNAPAVARQAVVIAAAGCPNVGMNLVAWPQRKCVARTCPEADLAPQQLYQTIRGVSISYPIRRGK